jgi:hypothetical protein
VAPKKSLLTSSVKNKKSRVASRPRPRLACLPA